MSKRAKKTRAMSPLAREDAKLQARYRRIYPDYDRDAKQFGRTVADFNAGFLEGQADGFEQLAKLVLPVFRDVSARRAGKWTSKQKRDWNAAYNALTKYAK